MDDDELDVAYREGRLTKRAFVRQRLDRGDDMTGALARAESLVPAAPPPPAPEPQAAADTVSERPVMRDELLVNFVGDGYVVYRPDSKRMHSLNHTAALVLELCTGRNDADGIARLLQSSFGLPDPPASETRRCLRELHAEGLIA